MLNPFKIKLFIFLVIITRLAFCTVYTVKKDGSGDFITIQEALNTSSDFDEIVVYPGIYEESIYVNKEIYLHSTAPLNQSIVESTVIQSTNSNAKTVRFGSGLTNTTVAGITIQNGHFGIYCYSYNKINIKHNIIENNWNDGIHYINGLICSNIIRNNMDDGIYYSNSIIEYNTINNNRNNGINNCNNIIRHNDIYENWNRGIYYCDDLIFDNTIHNNNDDGISSSDAIIISNLIYQNQGDGIAICNPSNIAYNIISDNLGSGIINCDSLIEQNIIVSNIASYGGGVSSCSGTIRNNLIAFNRTDNNGALYNCDAYVANNTIVNNFGGGIKEFNGVIYNCIIWGNEGSQIADGGILMNCCVQGGSTANNCITSNPQFVSAVDFRLQDNSPCVDTGFNLPDINNWIDLDGNDRVYNEIVDIGCYEVIPEPFTQHILLISIVIFCRLIKDRF